MIAFASFRDRAQERPLEGISPSRWVIAGVESLCDYCCWPEEVFRLQELDVRGGGWSLAVDGRWPRTNQQRSRQTAPKGSIHSLKLAELATLLYLYTHHDHHPQHRDSSKFSAYRNPIPYPATRVSSQVSMCHLGPSLYPFLKPRTSVTLLVALTTLHVHHLKRASISPAHPHSRPARGSHPET